MARGTARSNPPWVLLDGDDSLWAVPATRSLGIRPLLVVPLPIPRAGVMGLLPGEPPAPISTLLATDGDRVLLVEHDGVRIALLARAVLAVTPLPAPRPAPPGQATALVAGTTTWQDRMVLVLDLGVVVAITSAGDAA